MSYTSVAVHPVAGLGTLCPKGPMEAGQAVASCDGGQMATNCDACCPTDTFNVSTYRTLKGKQSLRYWNEKRVARIFQILTSPTISGGASLLEEFAYDEHLPAPASLQDRIRTAAQLFTLLFPLSRYTKKSKCKETDCTSSGYYSCWKEQPPAATPERLAAVARLSGVTVSAAAYQRSGYANAKLTTMGSVWGGKSAVDPPLPPAYIDWCNRIVAAIDGVLGGSGGDNAQRLLPLDTPAIRFFEVTGGAVVPQAWLRRLLDVLNPGPLVINAPLQTLTAMKPKLSVVPTRLMATVPVATSAAASTSRKTTEAAGDGDPFPVGLVAAGVVGLAAAGFFYVRSRRG